MKQRDTEGNTPDPGGGERGPGQRAVRLGLALRGQACGCVSILGRQGWARIEGTTKVLSSASLGPAGYWLCVVGA